MIKIVNGEEIELSDDEQTAWEAEQELLNAKSTSQQISEVPNNLFGGPTLKEVFNGN